MSHGILVNHCLTYLNPRLICVCARLLACVRVRVCVCACACVRVRVCVCERIPAPCTINLRDCLIC